MIVSSNSVGDTYTISQFIHMKDSDQITYRNFSILQRSIEDPSTVYSIDNIIYTYMDEIQPYKKLVSVTEMERIKYRYKPKLLAYDLYQTTEVYFILLALNGMCSVKEFDLRDKLFWALSPVDLSELMNIIYKAETEHIELNRNNLGISES